MGRVGAHQFVLTRTRNDLYYRLPRASAFVASLPPPEEAVRREGDALHVAWMKHFTDGTISMQRQTDDHDNVVLSVREALQAMNFENPLRDPVVLVKRDGALELRDGFHRIHEALARGYRGRIYCILLDMDQDDDEDD